MNNVNVYRIQEFMLTGFYPKRVSREKSFRCQAEGTAAKYWPEEVEEMKYG